MILRIRDVPSVASSGRHLSPACVCREQGYWIEKTEQRGRDGRKYSRLQVDPGTLGMLEGPAEFTA